MPRTLFCPQMKSRIMINVSIGDIGISFFMHFLGSWMVPSYSPSEYVVSPVVMMQHAKHNILLELHSFLVYCWSVAFLALTCKCVALSVMFTFVFPLIFGTSLQHILNPHICCEKQIGYEYAVNGQSLNWRSSNGCSSVFHGSTVLLFLLWMFHWSKWFGMACGGVIEQIFLLMKIQEKNSRYECVQKT